MNNDILELAKEIEFNIQEEAKAVSDYTEFLKNLDSADIDEITKNEIFDTIKEIIQDELNHQTRLHQTYTYLTGIEQNND